MSGGPVGCSFRAGDDLVEFVEAGLVAPLHPEYRRSCRHARCAAQLPQTAEIALAGIAETMREGLLAFSTAAGLAVFRALLDEELTAAYQLSRRLTGLNRRDCSVAQ